MKKIMLVVTGAFVLMSVIGNSQIVGASALVESGIVGLPEPLMEVRGVTGGMFPWVVDSGEAKLEDDGTLKVEVEGLLFSDGPAVGTTGAVTDVIASLTCEGAGVVATTAAVPLSAEGDTEIEEVVALPDVCVGPVILIRVGGGTMAWIAAAGF